MIAATAAESTSDTGWAQRMPPSPHTLERISRAGTKQMPCLPYAD